MSRPRSRRPLLLAREAGAGGERMIVLELDNAGWHTAPNLAVPDGIRLVYLPPYSPELQPAEHLWPVLDEPLANRSFGTLAELEQVVTERCRILNSDQLKLPLVAQASYPGLISRKPYHTAGVAICQDSAASVLKVQSVRRETRCR